MATDPKKNDELKDEDLAKLSGGTGDGGSDDELPGDGTVDPSTPKPLTKHDLRKV